MLRQPQTMRFDIDWSIDHSVYVYNFTWISMLQFIWSYMVFMDIFIC